MQQIAEFVEVLDRYVSGQIDFSTFKQILIRQASAAPRFAGAMIAALAAAERARQIHPDEAQELIAWLRDLQAVKPPQATDDPTLARAGSENNTGDPTRQPAHSRAEASTPAPQPASAPPDSGEFIREGAILKGRYLLDRRIGAGGMGLVFRARDLEEERIAREQRGQEEIRYIAIKVLRPDRLEFGRAVLEEADNSRRFVHQNVVRVLGCEQDGRMLFMTMEYLEGQPLDRLLERNFAQGMPWGAANDIIAGMGAGLNEAHKHGLVHCDFKPSNVLVTQAFTPKILDFGIARVRARAAEEQSGVPVGITRRYASPEMIDAWDRNVMADYQPDPRDDIFALACVAFEVLTGRHPFGTHDAQIARDQKLPVPRVRTLSIAQNAAIARAMAFEREQRTDTAAQFIAELVDPFDKGLKPPRSAALRTSISMLIAAIAVALVAVGYSFFFKRNSAAPLSVGVVPTTPALPPAATPATPTMTALLTRLGIDTAGADQQSLGNAVGVSSLIISAPRHVRLGSGFDQMQQAYGLCQSYARRTRGVTCSPDWYADEDRRDVMLKPFELDRDLVRVGAFRQFVDATHYKTQAERDGFAYRLLPSGLIRVSGGSWRNGVASSAVANDRPVVGVSFGDAQAYCRWHNQRLPTEDEWEYVARGPDMQLYPWGANSNDDAAVRSLEMADTPREEGIGGQYRNLAGVLWQWTETDYFIPGEHAAMRAGKVLKGGSWRDSNPANYRAAARRYSEPEIPDDGTGFRCAANSQAWPDAEAWLPSLNSPPTK